MYYRIKNRFEVDILRIELQSTNVPSIVVDRMCEIMDILDYNYGQSRHPNSYGGYLFFFPTAMEYKNLASVILQNYMIDPELYEFDEALSESQDMNWRERLYLLSSEDSIVFMYQQ